MMIFKALFIFLFSFGTNPDPYLGLQVGLTDATGPLTAKQVSVGVGGRAGYVFYEHVALGAFVHYYASSEPTENIAYIPILAEILFYPHNAPYDLSNYYVGAGFGTTHMVASDAVGKRSENATTLSLTAGYSVQLWESWNIGPEVQYHFVYSDRDNFNMLHVFASIKKLF